MILASCVAIVETRKVNSLLMMVSPLLVAVIISITFFYIYHRYQKYSALPLGPWNLPILGSSYLLDAKAPHLTFTKLAQKYGRIYSFKLGMLDTVVVSDAQLIKKIFLKNESLGRPPLYILDYFFRNNGLVWSYGNLWKDQRKFVINFLKTLGASKISSKKKMMESYIAKNVENIIQHLQGQGDAVVLDITEILQDYMCSISCNLFLGKSWSRDEKVWKELIHNLDELTRQTGPGQPLQILPFLRFLPKYKKSMDLVKQTFDNIHRIIDEIITETRESFREDDPCPSNLIHAFLLQKSKTKSEEIYNMQQLRFLVVDMFGASFETTLNSMLWLIYHLAAYQEIQEKVRQELIHVLQHKIPEFNDLKNLPYTEAAIAEAARIRSVLPSGVPHLALEDITLENVKIPKGTMIMPLIWAVHMDPTHWKLPDQFLPERFLNDDGKFYLPETYLPFQTGKRMCPGEEFAKMVIFLLIATLLQNFKIKSSNSGFVDLAGVCGLTLTPKPQNLILEKI